MRTDINDKLISWASNVDDGTIRQAEKTARLPIVEGHVALMPDAHIGIGATVGSVILTKGAVIPAAVGVDIGCGMIAAELDVTEDQLPDSLEPLLVRIEKAIPAGVGRGHDQVGRNADKWLSRNKPPTKLDTGRTVKTAKQFATLGAGNHFFELCLDERGRSWVVLHSGSRGIGNQLAPTAPVAGTAAPRPRSSSPCRPGRANGRHVWLEKRADALIDEIPSAYKDIDQVMADQADLVEIRHRLHQVLNYKGT